MRAQWSPVGASRRLVLQTGAVALAAVAGFVSFRMRARSAGEPAPAAGYGGARRLAAVRDVPAGGGLVLPGEQVVLTRDADGEVRAYSAVCTHQGCLVAGVEDGLIRCPCHGSAFDAASGEVVRGPATTALPAVPVRVEGESVVAG